MGCGEYSSRFFYGLPQIPYAFFMSHGKYGKPPFYDCGKHRAWHKNLHPRVAGWVGPTGSPVYGCGVASLMGHVRFNPA
jgi:hypothetical protein